MDIVAMLDETRSAINVLEHPFYVRWSAGELSAEELAGYAGEYRQAVVALADASERAAAKAGPEHAEGLSRHAAEERAHVSLWQEFENVMAAAAGTEPTAERDAHAGTLECARAWTAGDDLLEHLAVLYAIEAGQPEISRTKLEGLSEHYGYSEEGPATDYFTLHAARDVDHAREAAQLITELIAEHPEPETKALQMRDRAAAALRGNWRLLDDVETSD